MGEQKEEALSFDLDVEETAIDPVLLKKIEKDFRGDVINHPWTLGPLVLGGGSIAYAIALAPALGGFFVSIPVGVIALAIAGGNVVFRLVHVGEKYEEKVSELEEELKKKREAEEKAKIDRSVKFLGREFGRVKSPQVQRAQKELTELVQAFNEVEREIFLSKGGKLSATISGRFQELTKDAYKAGLRVLSCVLSLLREDPSLNHEVLRGDINRVEYEIAKLRKKESEEARQLLAIREGELARLRERMKKIDWRDTMVAKFIDRSDACEEVMRSAREDLIRIRAENTTEAFDSVISHLNSYMSVLVDVHEQIKKSRELSV